MVTESKLERARDAEMHKWNNLYVPALAIALRRYWGYGGKRIKDVINRAYEVSSDCANWGNEKSMIQMLDEEAGIELRSYSDNRSYKETAFLSTNIRYKKLNRAQYMSKLISETRWMRPQVLAILLLAMYRQQGFGYERLNRLIGQMEQIIADHDYKPDKIALTAHNEANFVFKEKEDE